MRILLALGVLVLVVVATAEEPRRVGGLRRPLAGADDVKSFKSFEQARKEAEAKYNCMIAWHSSPNYDTNWAAGQGKPFIFNIMGGVCMKFDENGRLVKAGKREQFEEIEWLFKRRDELVAESRQKEAAPKVKAPTDSGKGESTSLKTDQK